MMNEKQKQIELRKFFFKPPPFWEALPPGVWEELQALTYTQTFPKKTIIYSEGSSPRSLYIIRQGRVKVFIINNEGAQQVIYFLGKNEVFGHRSIVCDEASPVFIEAIDSCTLECIPRHHFEDFLRKSPELNTSFLFSLGHEYRVFVNKISMFAQKSVAERVALALLVLNEKFNDNSTSVRVIHFSREDLASYVGTATETFIRQLKILKETGAISTKGRKILLEDLDLLWTRAKIS